MSRANKPTTSNKTSRGKRTAFLDSVRRDGREQGIQKCRASFRLGPTSKFAETTDLAVTQAFDNECDKGIECCSMADFVVLDDCLHVFLDRFPESNLGSRVASSPIFNRLTWGLRDSNDQAIQLLVLEILVDLIAWSEPTLAEKIYNAGLFTVVSSFIAGLLNLMDDCRGQDFSPLFTRMFAGCVSFNLNMLLDCPDCRTEFLNHNLFNLISIAERRLPVLQALNSLIYCLMCCAPSLPWSVQSFSQSDVHSDASRDFVALSGFVSTVYKLLSTYRNEDPVYSDLLPAKLNQLQEVHRSLVSFIHEFLFTHQQMITSFRKSEGGFIDPLEWCLDLAFMFYTKSHHRIMKIMQLFSANQLHLVGQQMADENVHVLILKQITAVRNDDSTVRHLPLLYDTVTNIVISQPSIATEVICFFGFLDTAMADLCLHHQHHAYWPQSRSTLACLSILLQTENIQVHDALTTHPRFTNLIVEFLGKRDEVGCIEDVIQALLSMIEIETKRTKISKYEDPSVALGEERTLPRLVDLQLEPVLEDLFNESFLSTALANKVEKLLNLIQIFTPDEELEMLGCEEEALERLERRQDILWSFS